MGIKIARYSRARRGVIGRVESSIAKKVMPRLVDPLEVGVTPAKYFRAVALAAMLLTPIVAGLIVASLAGYVGLGLAIVAASVWILLTLLPKLWAWTWGSMVDREVPALLAYLLPYTPTTSHIADLIAEAASGSEFKWVRFEGERLRAVMRMGVDPERALSFLASTTRSRTLASILDDYLHAQKLGASRSQLTLLLLRNSLDAVRSSWESYHNMVRGLGELGAALTVSLAAAVPIAYMSSTSMVGAIPLIIAISALALALIALALRPSLGEGRPPAPVFAVAYSAPLIVMAAVLNLDPIKALALGTVLALIVEVLAAWQSSREARALFMLKRAADNAKYGLDYEAPLREAEPVASQVVKAILRASKRAGKLGVGEALDTTYRMIVEARVKARELKGPAIMLALVSSAAPALAVYTLKFMEKTLSSSQLLGLPGAGDVDFAIRLLVAVAPLVTLPAAVMHRPWIPSLLPGLLASALAYIAQWLPTPSF